MSNEERIIQWIKITLIIGGTIYLVLRIEKFADFIDSFEKGISLIVN